MGKYLSLVGVLLVLVGFHLMPIAEAQEPYVSPALLLGINFDSSGDDGLEFYPSLSAQVTVGVFETVLENDIAGATLGYQFSWAHPNNLYFDLQAGIAGIAGAGVGLSWQQSSSKERSIRGKLFWPFPVGLGIEYDSKQRLKPYLYGSAAPALGLLFGAALAETGW